MKSFKSKHKGRKLEELVPRSDMVSEPLLKYGEDRKCLYCYKRLELTQVDFHTHCSQNFFGAKTAPKIDYNRNNLKELAEKIIQTQMTVTGVQPKLSLSINRKEKSDEIYKMTLVGLYGDYILKPPSDVFKNLPEIEHCVMQMAALCGLSTVPNSLIKLSDETVCYITKRIDRKKGDKIHMEDMCQLTERLTEDKYKGSHEQVAKTIRKYSAAPMLDVANFYDLVFFSYLTGNADMHLKNFSMISTSNGQYKLSPTYDLLSTELVLKEDTEELALTLNGKKRKLNGKDFIEAMSKSGLSEKIAMSMFENFYYAIFEMNTFIEKSFLPDDMKFEFQILLISKWNQLKIDGMVH
jgi:serine/threonine-protein kinase HipA